MTKYHNRITEVDGIYFHSQKEAARYSDLKLNQRAGAISNLRLQVKYPLVVNGARVGAYIADFVYCENGAEIVEDVKGVRTAVYQLKKKLVRALYGIEILET